MEHSGPSRRARGLRNVSLPPRSALPADEVDLRGSPDEVVKRVQTIFR